MFHRVAKSLNDAADRISDRADKKQQPQSAKNPKKTKPALGTGHLTPAQGPVSVPELDPNSAGAALTLVLGGSLLLIDRRRRRSLAR